MPCDKDEDCIDHTCGMESDSSGHSTCAIPLHGTCSPSFDECAIGLSCAVNECVAK
jgi:hypothetical protein